MFKLASSMFFVGIALLLAGSADSAMAQRPGPGGGFGRMMGRLPLAMLANQDAVQAELKLTDAQKKQLDDLQEEANRNRPNFPQGGPPSEEFLEAMRKRNAEMDDKIGKVLEAPQLKRLKEIRLQQGGAGALLDDEVAKALKVTDEQKSKIQELQNSSFEAMRSAREQNQGSPDAIREQSEKIRKETKDKALAVLTDEQRKQYDALAGAAFSGTIRFGFGGRGR